MRKLKKYYGFISFWVLDSLLLYLASVVYPAAYVLGTFRLSVFWAAIFAGFLWTVLVWFSEPIVAIVKLKISDKMKTFFYLFANFVALWLVARISAYSGFGIASFVWAFLLALIANFVQYLIMKVVKF
ncbi:phage holin family protein [Candidatus Woesebacteria bacterium]|nr:phage holin family protein [Candidatus Woesebacteria bacterium]